MRALFKVASVVVALAADGAPAGVVAVDAAVAVFFVVVVGVVVVACTVLRWGRRG